MEGLEPISLHEMIKKLKRYYGLVIASYGAFVLLAALTWLACYFERRGLGMTGLRIEFGPEFGYWSPVLLFVVFGLLLIFHGRRLRQDEPISLLESGEVLGLLVATAAAGYLALIEGP